MSDIAPRELPARRPRLVLVEDDPAVRRSLHFLLQAHDYDVRAYASGAHLCSDDASLTAACLIADYRMPDYDGVETLVALRDRGCIGRAVLVTGFPSPVLTDIAISAGFDAILEKPLREHLLLGTIRQLVPSNGGN